MPTSDTKRVTPRTGRVGRTKIDWKAARSYFARNPEVSFGDIGRKFGVSDVAVGKHAKAEDWEGYRAEVQAVVDERRRDQDIRSLEQRQADTIRVAEKLRALALADDADIDAKTAAQLLPAYAKLEELFAGRATEITAVEVHDYLRRLVFAIDDLVASSVRRHLNGTGGRVLSEIREGMPLLLEQTAGGLGGGAE